jgi:tRNA 2-selenouridine synthase
MGLSVEDFLRLARRFPVIDVRSEGEFEHGHIPSAINIPLFDNAERAEVGAIYKQIGKETAIVRGLEIVGPKLANFVRQAQAVAVDRQVLVHCWRGGMRSGSFAWLLRTAGLDAQTLTGGYKAYRQAVLSIFEPPARLLVLGGETGSGKTEVLKYLKESGEQVIDLEALAHHRGSAFGSIGQQPQPSTEQFENDLANVWQALDFTKRIWIEDESIKIGVVQIPLSLWYKMKSAPIIRFHIPQDLRVARLIDDYGDFPIEILSESVLKIQKKLGGLATTQALDALQNGNLAVTVQITLNYYDRSYDGNHQRRDFKDIHILQSDTAEAKINASKVLDFVQGLGF